MAHLLEVQDNAEKAAACTTSAVRRLHLGCFDRPISGWINTDITPHIWLSRIPGLATLLWRLGRLSDERHEQHGRGVFRLVRYMNVAKRFPYPDNSFDAVFSSHMLEHLYREDAERCLSEIHRTLRPGGVCRIAVPDLDAIIQNYDPTRPDALLTAFYEPKGERQKNSHHWLYNANSLTALVKKIGFQDAYECAYREGRCPDIDVLDNRPDGSLFVECIKL
jgi:SAM-dependent methyltransferase